MGNSTAVALLTKAANFYPTVEQPSSIYAIYEGVGGSYSNYYGAPHFQDVGEPDAHAAHSCRYMTQ